MTYYFDPEPDRQPEPDYGPALNAEPQPRPWLVRFADNHEDYAYIDRGEEIVAARDHRWAGRAIILATIAMAVLNAAAITSWASSLPPSWASETVRAVAQAWSDRLAQIGLDQPRKAVRQSYEAQKAKRWG